MVGNKTPSPPPTHGSEGEKNISLTVGLTCKVVMSFAAICPFPDAGVYWYSQEHRNTLYILQFPESIFVQ